MERTIARPAAAAALARVELSGMLWLRILDFGLWEVSLEPPSGCYDMGQRGVVGFKSIVLENTLVLVNVYICSKLRLSFKAQGPTYL